MAAGSKRGRKAPPQARPKARAPGLGKPLAPRRAALAPRKPADASPKQQLAEARAQQTATAEILRVISSSPADVQPVLDAVAERAARICDARVVDIVLREGDIQRVAATFGDLGRPLGMAVPLNRDTVMGRSIVDGKPVQVADLQTTQGEFALGRELAIKYGHRSILAVPLMREGSALGTILVRRAEVRPFDEKHVALLQTFADQAAIAIENARLFNETREALERQTATADILRVIASSPSDVQPVFDAIAASARRLLGGDAALVARRDADMLHLAAYTSTNESADAALRALWPSPITGRGHMGRAVLGAEPVWIDDIQNDTSYSEAFRESARIRGVRSVVSVPMLREGEAIGVISVNRSVAGNFSEHQTNLLMTFADQAVIAIENVRLFNETKEALDRQTATADVLAAISGAQTDVTPVFEAIARNAQRLCNAVVCNVLRVDRDMLQIAASHGFSPEQEKKLREKYPVKAGDASVLSGRVIASKQIEQIEDIRTDPDYDHAHADGIAGWRRMLGVPMLRDDVPLGVIVVAWHDHGKTPESLVALLKTFAAQAVIAIENVRLFNETKEALEQQTATAEILKVISESPTDTQPVFDAIVQAGLRLFPDAVVLLGIPAGGKVRAAAIAHADPAIAETMRKRFPIPLLRDRMHAAAILDSELIDIPDAEAAVDGRYAAGVENFLASGFRAITIAPMICSDAAIGAISVARPRPGPLSEKQVALLRTFAAQAVIAVENVRVFKELEARTGALTRSVEQLTALGEVGQAISSTLDLDHVLKTIVQRAVQITGLDGGSIYEYDDRSEEFHLRAAQNLSEEVVQVLRETPAHRSEGVIGRAVETGEPVEIAEMLDDSYQSPRRDTLIQAGYRALLVVPLRRDEHIIGALAVNRKAPGHFSHDVVELLKTFATQSALAIQNARLFREIAEKGKQLEVASRHKSNFLASMSHELRTPLNAILGFNEMILGKIYGDVPADMKEPLEDIQKSGKHLLRLINNVLDLAKIESGRMELALQDYSVQDTVEGVRATLRPLAAEKGLEFLASVPRELPLAHGDSGRITQCLLNLAGNALKFTSAGRVEISAAEQGGLLVYRVTDTGMGIAPDKIGGLFTEFKQTDATIAHEYGGTGLGLSISRKFVEMHGGRIWVESEPGKGSAFIFEIPLRVNS